MPNTRLYGDPDEWRAKGDNSDCPPHAEEVHTRLGDLKDAMDALKDIEDALDTLKELKDAIDTLE